MPASYVTAVDAPCGRSLAESAAAAFALVPQLLPAAIPADVVIKPNLCDIAVWETGVTTDPAWLAVLAKELRARRPDVRIRVVESDAISAYKSFRSCDETFDRLGYREAAAEAGVELVNLSDCPAWEVALPGCSIPLRVPELLFDEFFYISLANVKVHPYERFTGTVKNGYGLLPQADRSELHMHLPEVLCTLYRLCTPDLAILDGRVGLEGKGPIIGNVKRLDRIIIGNNGIAVDEVVCRMIGFSPKQVPHLRYATRVLRHDSKAVEVSGNVGVVPFAFDPEGAHDLIVAKFATRRFHRRLEAWSLRAMNWWHEAKRHPLQFGRRATRRLFRGRRRVA